MTLLEKVKKLMDGTEKLAEDIYILILEYYLSQNKNVTDIPYNGKSATKENRGVTFKVAQLPEDLQKIIVRYIIHISN
jgi:hypothetical protein